MNSTLKIFINYDLKPLLMEVFPIRVLKICIMYVYNLSLVNVTFPFINFPIYCNNLSHIILSEKRGSLVI